MDTTSSTTSRLQVILEAEPCGISMEEPTVSERAVAQLRSRHWTMLVVGIVVISMSMLLSVRDSGSEAKVSMVGIELPPLCGSRIWFGSDCPGCGLTRSFIALSSGEFAKSLEYHRVGWLMWLAIVLQLPYRVFSLREMRTGTVIRRWPTWFGYVLIAALLGNWTLKVLGW